jgi:hypothetical protein
MRSSRRSRICREIDTRWIVVRDSSRPRPTGVDPDYDIAEIASKRVTAKAFFATPLAGVV